MLVSFRTSVVTFAVFILVFTITFAIVGIITLLLLSILQATFSLLLLPFDCFFGNF